MKFNKLMGINLFDEHTYSLIEEFESFKDHKDLRERLKKNLYYGKLPSTPRPSLPLTEVTVELFSKSVPKVHLDVLDVQYVASISKKTSLSPCSLMLALMYLERLRHKSPQYLQTISSCDLFLVSMMVASKYLCDDVDEGGLFNDEWAQSAGIDLKEINHLEKEFLCAMEWELFVQPTEFFDFLADIETRLARYEGMKRNWLTYTEICLLAHRQHLLSSLLDFSKVAIVSGMVYVSAAVTLVAATTLALRVCTLVPTTVTSVSLQQLSTPCCPARPILQNEGSSRNCSFQPGLPTDEDHHNWRNVAAHHQNPGMWQLDSQISVAVWDVFKFWPNCCGPNSVFL